MAAKRKRLFVLVELSVPPGITAGLARREVRERIRNMAGWSWESEGVRLISLKPARRPSPRRAPAPAPAMGNEPDWEAIARADGWRGATEADRAGDHAARYADFYNPSRHTFHVSNGRGWEAVCRFYGLGVRHE